MEGPAGGGLWRISMAGWFDAGALLLGETDKAIGLADRFAACFADRRSPLFTVHALKALIAQRVFGLALGYEDLNDYDELRGDPVLGVLLGKLDRAGEAPGLLAGKSTLNRLEHAPGAGKTPRYHRIGHDGPAIEKLFVDLFLDAHQKAPRRIVLDLDATDDPLHGDQEGRFFHGYYDGYCRSMCSAAGISSPPSSGVPTSTEAPGQSRRWIASRLRSKTAGRRCRSCCAPIPASRARP